MPSKTIRKKIRKDKSTLKKDKAKMSALMKKIRKDKHRIKKDKKAYKKSYKSKSVSK